MHPGDKILIILCNNETPLCIALHTTKALWQKSLTPGLWSGGYEWRLRELNLSNLESRGAGEASKRDQQSTSVCISDFAQRPGPGGTLKLSGERYG